MSGKKWTKEEINYLYNNPHQSIQELAKVFGRTYSAVRQKRRLLGIANKQIRYSINENFFKIWTEEMAYALGFIYADGYLNEQDTYLRIEIKDKCLLEKLNRVMESTYKIVKRKNREIYYINISNRIIVSDLQKLGVQQAKSKIMTFPNIPKEYFWHFVRGYFDGDGTAYIAPNGSLVLVIVSGSNKFLAGLQNRLQMVTILEDLGNKYRLFIRGDSRKQFYEYIYEGSTIYLERKHRIMREYFMP